MFEMKLKNAVFSEVIFMRNTSRFSHTPHIKRKKILWEASDYSLYCDKASFTAHHDGMRSGQIPSIIPQETEKQVKKTSTKRFLCTGV